MGDLALAALAIVIGDESVYSEIIRNQHSEIQKKKCGTMTGVVFTTQNGNDAMGRYHGFPQLFQKSCNSNSHFP